jgi:5-methylcytosine-specific restriction protein A
MSPDLARRPCPVRRCGRLVGRDETRCTVHQREYERAVDERRGTAASRGYDADWRRRRKEFLRRHPWCEEPGCPYPSEHVDHKVPLAQGGQDAESNLQALCRTCHSRKTMRELNRKRAAGRRRPGGIRTDIRHGG